MALLIGIKRTRIVGSHISVYGTGGFSENVETMDILAEGDAEYLEAEFHRRMNLAYADKRAKDEFENRDVWDFADEIEEYTRDYDKICRERSEYFHYVEYDKILVMEGFVLATMDVE
jgi:hypothetical protein